MTHININKIQYRRRNKINYKDPSNIFSSSSQNNHQLTSYSKYSRFTSPTIIASHLENYNKKSKHLRVKSNDLLLKDFSLQKTGMNTLSYSTNKYLNHQEQIKNRKHFGKKKANSITNRCTTPENNVDIKFMTTTSDGSCFRKRKFFNYNESSSNLQQLIEHLIRKKHNLQSEIKNLKNEKEEIMKNLQVGDYLNIENLQKEILKYNKISHDCKQSYIELSYDYNKLKNELSRVHKKIENN